MTLPLALLISSAGCAQSDSCRTVDSYLRALKAMDAERLESFIDPAYRSKRADGSETPFNPERNRRNRGFERGTKTRWTYSILGIDGDRVTILAGEENEFYRLLGVGVRTQVTVYAAKNGRVYFAQNLTLVDEHGKYEDAYRAFVTWIRQQPAALADPEVVKGDDLVFSAASAPKLLDWLRKYRQARKDPS